MSVTRGRIVVFKPSEKTQQKFKNKQHETYPAIVTDINEGTSVDLTVFGVGEEVHVYKVKHATEAEANRSSWDWPEMKK